MAVVDAVAGGHGGRKRKWKTSGLAVKMGRVSGSYMQVKIPSSGGCRGSLSRYNGESRKGDDRWEGKEKTGQGRGRQGEGVCLNPEPRIEVVHAAAHTVASGTEERGGMGGGLYRATHLRRSLTISVASLEVGKSCRGAPA